MCVCVCVCVCNNAVSTCRIHCCSQHSMTSRHTARQSTKVCTLSVNQPNAHSASVNQPNEHTARQSAKCTRSTSISLIMHTHSRSACQIMYTQHVNQPNAHTVRQSAKLCTRNASICQIMHTQCVNLPNYAHTGCQFAKCTHSASICQMHTQCVNLPLKCTHCTHIQTWEEPKQTSLKFKMLHSPALKWGQTLDNTVQCWDHSADKGGGGGGGGEEKWGVKKIFLKRVKAISRNGYQPFHTGSGSVHTGSEWQQWSLQLGHAHLTCHCTQQVPSCPPLYTGVYLIKVPPVPFPHILFLVLCMVSSQLILVPYIVHLIMWCWTTFCWQFNCL